MLVDILKKVEAELPIDTAEAIALAGAYLHAQEQLYSITSASTDKVVIQPDSGSTWPLSIERACPMCHQQFTVTHNAIKEQHSEPIDARSFIIFATIICPYCLTPAQARHVRMLPTALYKHSQM